MKIQKYTKENKEEVIEMVSEILTQMFNGDPTEFKVIKEFNITKDYILYLVVIINDKIIGIGALKKLNKDEVRLKRMYVTPEYQGRGISQKILDKLMAFAEKQKFKRVLFHTYPIMENARRFHKRNGFVETTGKDPDQIHLVKSL